jgi:diguanylate cyclase (GGDEF)-like protein
MIQPSGLENVVDLAVKNVNDRHGFRRESDVFLYKLHQEMHSTPKIKDTLMVAVTALKDRGYVCPRIYRKDGNWCNLVVGIDLPSEVAQARFSVRNDSVLEYIYQENNPIYVQDDVTLDSLDSKLGQSSDDPLFHILREFPEHKGLVAVPYDSYSELLHKNISGIIAANYGSSRKVDDAEKRLLDQVGWFVEDNVARLLEMKQFQQVNRQLELLNHQLELQIKLDGPTGLYNKKTFHEDLGGLFSEIQYGAAFGYLFWMDFDKFREINNQYGHPEGDKVIEGVGRFMQEIARTDRNRKVYRTGGDEFALVQWFRSGVHIDIVDTDMFNLSKRLRDGVHGLYVPKGCPQLSASIGVVGTTAGKFFSSDEWYRYTDNASYKAKRNGADQVNFLGVHKTENYRV